MNVDPDVNYEELARCTDDFNGAQCKAVCVEAGTLPFFYFLFFYKIPQL
jgi:26S proteasome regulatory subunit T5